MKKTLLINRPWYWVGILWVATICVVSFGIPVVAQSTMRGPIFTAPVTASSAPTLVQGPIASPNDVQSQTPLDTIGYASFLQKPFLRTTQSGNKEVVLVITASATSNFTVTDSGSNSGFSSPIVSEVAGSMTTALYAASVTTGSTYVKVNFTTSTNADNTQIILWEYQNLGSVDVTCNATVTSGTSLACSSMTTTAPGDFILAAANVVTYSSTPSGFANGFTQQSGWGLATADGLSWSATQTIIQSSAGAITPTLTAAAAVTQANIVGVSFKAASGGAGPPASGPYVLSEQFIDGGNSAWGFSSTSSSTTQNIQFPCYGNDPWLLAAQGDAVTISSVTDTNSNTWAGLTRVDSAGDVFAMQWWHTTNASPTCNGTEKLTITYSASAASQVPYWIFFDLANSLGYDSSATCGAGSTPCPINTTCNLTTSCSGATITPSTYPSLILSAQNQDYDTISGVNVGNFISATEQRTSGGNCSGSSPFCYAGPGFEQDGGLLIDNLASGSAAITWSVANTQSRNVGASFSSTVAIK